MKRIIYIFWFIFQAYSTEPCEIYKIPSTSLEKGICKIKEGNIIYVQKCYPAFQCEQNNNSVGLCQADYSLKIEEENCNFNFDCYSNNCSNNVCHSINIGESCINHFQCSISAYCDGRCQKLVGNGERCKEDYQCIIGHLCSDGKCVKMFSLEKGNKTDKPYVCKSGYAENNICAETNSTDSLKKCESNEDCTIEVDTGNGKKSNNNKDTCKCNLEGEKYCILTSSSKEWKNYVETFNSEINNMDGIHIAGMRNATNDYSWGSQTIIDSYRKFDVKYFNVNKNILIALGSKFLFFHKIIVSLLFFMF